MVGSSLVLVIKQVSYQLGLLTRRLDGAERGKDSTSEVVSLRSWHSDAGCWLGRGVAGVGGGLRFSSQEPLHRVA